MTHDEQKQYENELAHCRRLAKIKAPPYLLRGVDDDALECTTVFELNNDWKGLVHFSNEASRSTEFQAVNTRLPFVTQRYSSLHELMEQAKVEFGTRFDPFAEYIRDNIKSEQ